jgi:hypothetical protein
MLDSVAGIRELVVLLDERGDELDDRPDLEVRLSGERARFRRCVWVGRTSRHASRAL